MLTNEGPGFEQEIVQNVSRSWEYFFTNALWYNMTLQRPWEVYAANELVFNAYSSYDQVKDGACASHSKLFTM